MNERLFAMELAYRLPAQEMKQKRFIEIKDMFFSELYERTATFRMAIPGVLKGKDDEIIQMLKEYLKKNGFEFEWEWVSYSNGYMDLYIEPLPGRHMENDKMKEHEWSFM